MSKHLHRKSSDLERYRHYFCPASECQEPLESVRAIKKALQRGCTELPCYFCGSMIPLWDTLEKQLANKKYQRRVQEMEQKALATIDRESGELVLHYHAHAIAEEAGQDFETLDSIPGIDATIQLRDLEGQPSNHRIYLQLKTETTYHGARSHLPLYFPTMGVRSDSVIYGP